MGALRPQIQISTLRWVLAIASPGGVPVVLHVRGGKDDVHSAQAHIQCMRQCRASLKSGHPIHLHCFDGGWEQAKLWLDNFPVVHFGFTGSVKAFSQDTPGPPPSGIGCPLRQARLGSTGRVWSPQVPGRGGEKYSCDQTGSDCGWSPSRGWDECL
ncbi:tatD [Mytilus coruscus]|uniref:TatD n=1 Tax=Mytilus coruscus TaxID=42192 RepID=A0A6J8E9H3_MYTCO|nr:tatD [Mytilus coruscus]